MLLLLLLAADPPPPVEEEVVPPPAAVCRDRSPCTLVEELGPGPGGRVIHVAFAEGLEAGWDRPIQSPGANIGCVAHEAWWVPEDPARAPSLLVAMCNDGYGAAMVGEDSLSVEEGRFRHVQYGGSAWRWENITLTDLASLEVVEEVHSVRYMAVTKDTVRWDWTTFSGTRTRERPPCGHPEGPAVVGETLLIPRVGAPDYEAGWREAGLGACAVHLDSAGTHGLLLKGSPGAAEDARLAAVVIQGVLYVEIEDDALPPAHERWKEDDRLELWLSTAKDDPFCTGLLAAVQWIVRPDGTVIPGYNATGTMAVEQVAFPGGVRLRIPLPGPSLDIALLYADRDEPEATAPERQIATSRIDYGHGESLGQLYTVEPTAARCVVKGGRLEPERL